MARQNLAPMQLIYNFLFWIFFLLASPFYFLKMWRRGNWLAGFEQRFGRYDLTPQQYDSPSVSTRPPSRAGTAM